MTNKLLAGILFAILLLWSVPECHAIQFADQIMKRAESQLYVRELTPRNGNRSPEIDGYLKYLGLPPGLSYCITFDIWAIGKTFEANGKKCPVPQIGKVSTFLKTVRKDRYAYTVITPKQVEYGIVKLKPAMIACWSHGKSYDSADYTWSGHAELVKSPTTFVKFKTIGANTVGVDDADAQREQTGKMKSLGPIGGVWEKNRSVSKLSSFCTEAFVDVNI